MKLLPDNGLATLVYIVGQGHSGTTLLDLACSSGGLAVSLGELERTLKHSATDVEGQACSCGAPVLDCAFWGDYFRVSDGLSAEERNQRVLETATELVGGDGFVIDSSKTIARLERVSTLNPIVLHMSKDMRAYIISRLKRAERRNLPPPRPLDEGISWWRQNTRVLKALDAMKIDALSVSYEELCLSPHILAERIHAHANAPLINANAILSSSNHHIVHGNRMLHSHSQTLRYDYKWMARSEWLLPYMVLRSARKLNEQRYKH